MAVTAEMGDEEYDQICRLYVFLRWVVRRRHLDRGRSGDLRAVTPDAGDDDYDVSGVWHSLMSLFEETSAGDDDDADNAPNNVRLSPKLLRGGTLILSFDHTLFFRVLNRYYHQNNNNDDTTSQQSQSTPFESYLHRRPDRALACLGCAMGLLLKTIWRQNQPSSLVPSRQPTNPNSSSLSTTSSNSNTTLDTAIYKPRFYNLSSSNRIRMAHIRTGTVDSLISLRGTVTKARPKRLRVLDAGFTCCKCGSNQLCTFIDGKYSCPKRCEDLKCRSQKFEVVRKVANFCDVQELRIQEVREEFCDDVENSGMGGDRDSGRAPRQMEVEVSNDLVDRCQAGDTIVVVGVVRAMNSALASGRRGKRAEENSTYKLYVVAHSIVNLTAEDSLRSGRGEHDLQSGGDQRPSKRQRTGASSSGVDYTDQQLQQINNIAHADHLMYSMPTRMAFPFDLLVRSLCPSIIGNDLVKAGMVLCLLGGTPPQVSGLEAQSGMTIRSNSHCLIVGDPGMGKSQMLLAANQVASRSVYVGGNTASSTGLTVSLTKESGGDMGIEAGALVLADRGVCCLDELDK